MTVLARLTTLVDNGFRAEVPEIAVGNWAKQMPVAKPD
jgi:hypothetical protein